MLLIHKEPEVLGAVSEALCEAGVPHCAVLGDLSDPEELLRRVYRAGVTGERQ